MAGAREAWRGKGEGGLTWQGIEEEGWRGRGKEGLASRWRLAVQLLRVNEV